MSHEVEAAGIRYRGATHKTLSQVARQITGVRWERSAVLRAAISERRGMKPKTVRWAIYNRKSSEEGLEQEFNSHDGQRAQGTGQITAFGLSGAGA